MNEVLVVAALKAITNIAIALRGSGVSQEILDEAVRSEEDRSDELIERLKQH
jgi:hypothetical protein